MQALRSAARSLRVANIAVDGKPYMTMSEHSAASQAAAKLLAAVQQGRAEQILETAALDLQDSDAAVLQIRQDIFSLMLLCVLTLGVLTAIPSMMLAWQQGMWGTMLIDMAAIMLVGFLWCARKLPYYWRLLPFLLMTYLMGLWFLVVVGDPGFTYLMAFVFMTALFCRIREVIAAQVLASLTILLVGYLLGPKLRVDTPAANTIWYWLIVTLNFNFVSVLLSIACNFLFKKLEQALHHQQLALESLELGQGRLRATNEELRLIEAAVARLNDLVTIFQREPGQQTLSSLKIVFVNQAFEQRSACSAELLRGRSLNFLIGPQTQLDQIERLRQGLQSDKAVHLELICYSVDGSAFWLEADIVPLANAAGEYTHWVATGRDISARKTAEEHIHQLAYYDVLTGLPNRRLLMDRMQTLLLHARRHACFCAVLYIDLDNFKLINDARGHQAGDAILLQVTQRLQQALRENDTVARVGGDEFVVLLSMEQVDLASGAHVSMSVAEKIRQSMLHSFEAAGLSYGLTCSIGISLLPRENQSPEDLLREADTAMYRAKMAGRNQIAFYEASMQSDVERRLTIEHELTTALDTDQLQLYIQPQICADGSVAGGELLLRWNHPQQGLVSPALFIPIAEESNLIIALGDWVLQQGCRILNLLRQQGIAQSLSVNVSPKQFRQPDFVQKVRAVLLASGADPACLILEVTEGLLIDNLHQTMQRMQELSGLGIRFSIDDFGSGYSSFAYLKKLPIYELKIDQSFIRDMSSDPNDRAIVQSILSMAEHLDLQVVAEGVETAEQADFLRCNGCPAMQGYYFYRPMPVPQWVAIRTAAAG